MSDFFNKDTSVSSNNQIEMTTDDGNFTNSSELVPLNPNGRIQKIKQFLGNRENQKIIVAVILTAILMQFVKKQAFIPYEKVAGIFYPLWNP